MTYEPTAEGSEPSAGDLFRDLSMDPAISAAVLADVNSAVDDFAERHGPTIALTHDFCYQSNAVASRILLPAGWAGGGRRWRGESAWPHEKN